MAVQSQSAFTGDEFANLDVSPSHARVAELQSLYGRFFGCKSGGQSLDRSPLPLLAYSISSSVNSRSIKRLPNLSIESEIRLI